MQDNISRHEADGVSSEVIAELKQDRERLEREIKVLEEMSISEFLHKKEEFFETVVKSAWEEAARIAKHKHMLIQELDVAFRQTRMVHQDRWREFALIGIASSAVWHHPLPDVQDAMLGVTIDDDRT
ncbi:hypothetical protein R1sor_013455 [Riccia sorocarpa]|uniref:Uncharacterized protein n=1 Tax=Riccia sorocarpa TaxID=122646 RepID=A0ABD3HAQ2_9MARC